MTVRLALSLYGSTCNEPERNDSTSSTDKSSYVICFVNLSYPNRYNFCSKNDKYRCTADLTLYNYDYHHFEKILTTVMMMMMMTRPPLPLLLMLLSLFRSSFVIQCRIRPTFWISFRDLPVPSRTRRDNRGRS